MIRVAHLILSRQLGGAERVVSELIKHWRDDASVDARLAVQNSLGISAFEDVPVDLDLDFSGAWRSLGFLSAVLRLRDFIKREKIQILHSHWWILDLMAALAVKGTRVRHIAHLHAMMDLYLPRKFRIRRWAVTSALRSARSTIVSCSQPAADEFASEMGWKGSITVVPNAVQTDKFRDTGDRPCLPPLANIGMAGRLVRVKGHDVLLRAVRSLVDDGYDCQLEIAGAGDAESDIRSQIHAFGLSERVRMLGTVAGMADFLKRKSIIIQSSTGSEGLPLTVLEAMSSGCIVIASSVGALTTLINHGANGFLVQSGNSDDLAVALRTVANASDEDLDRIRRCGAATIESFYSIDSMAESLTDIYRQ